MPVRPLLLLILSAALAGCAAVRPQSAFYDVEETLDGRLPYQVAWHTGSDADREAEGAVAALLADSLTAEAAVQVALLNNRRLQATYEDLGVAQAELVQAGLLANPVFGARALWALEEAGPPDLGFNVALDFLDVFYRPLRRRVAQSAYEAARYEVAGAVLDLAARTRAAYVQAQAAQAQLSLQRRIMENAEAGYTASRLLREAGNVPAVDLLAEQARYEQARLDGLVAEGALAERREALTRLMGLFGADAGYALAGALPPVPETLDFPTVAAAAGPAPGERMDMEMVVEQMDDASPVFDVAAFERAAVAASLDLAARRQDVETAAVRLGLSGAEAVLPELHAGGEIEREEGEWEAGPEVEIALPLFDQGQARRAAARAELRRARALFYATAVDVRSAARQLAQRLATTRRAGLHYQRVVLPLRAELAGQTMLQYNAMQTGVFGVLQAQQMEAEAARRYFDALAAYWEARADADLLLQGRMPDLDGPGLMPGSAGPAMRDAGH
jgi:cobalt-zinc-cadmium efflux system outer membrane protein